MKGELRVVVLEGGSALTHDLTRACRGSGVEVFGPVRTVEEARAAARLETIHILAIEGVETSLQLVGDAASSMPWVRILAVAVDTDPGAGAAIIAAGASGVLDRHADRLAIVQALRRTAAGELILPAAHLSALVELIGIAREPLGKRGLNSLTRREREVLSLLADGLTTAEVASSLSISVLTVQSHVKNVLAKFGVHSKVEAIRYAWRSGVLRMPVGA